MPQRPADKTTVAPSALLVILAFAAVYIIWGSTYFFIRIAVHDIPPFMMGAFRFTASGLLMLAWCKLQKERLFDWQVIKNAAAGGVLMLFLGNGIVIWVERYLGSALVAILVSSAPLWFVLLDRKKWNVNFSSRSIITGLLIGFAGVILLFYEKISGSINSSKDTTGIFSLFLLLIGSMAWTSGSLYSKYHSSTSSTQLVTAWQMLSAGIIFLVLLPFTGEIGKFNWQNVSQGAWLAVAYLVIFGSIIAFSAYVWLLKVRPATQVSTYGYVNPVVAVFLGMFFAGEQVSWLQVDGLAIILGSVLMINLSSALVKNAAQRKLRKQTPAE